MKTPFPQSLLYRAPGRWHGATGEGPLGKTQLNMDKVKGGLKMQIKESSAFLCVHSGATSVSIFTLSYCAHPSRNSPAPGPADLYRSPGSSGPQARRCPRGRSGWERSSALAEPRAELLTPAGC